MVYHANGAVVPDDTLSVKAAKINHFNLKAHEYAKKGYVSYVAPYAAAAVYAHPYAHALLFRGKREAKADPQWLVAHPDGAVTPDDTPAVKAAKINHYALKAHDYAKKGYFPYVSPYVAPSVYMHPYTYGIHHLRGKREAEADPQYFFNYPTAYTHSSFYNAPRVYNTHYTYPYAYYY